MLALVGKSTNARNFVVSGIELAGVTACRNEESVEIECKYDTEKLEMFLREYFAKNDLEQSRIALDFAIRQHEGQTRSEGLPYIVHPMMMTCHAIAMGLTEDDFLAILLLHDVCEDCPVEPEDLPVNDNVQHGVACLTNQIMPGETKEESMARYMEQVRESKQACLAKLLDRCNNVSSMVGAFSRKKVYSYVRETENYIYPLIEHTKQTYPEYANYVFILEYQIKSVIHSIE